MIVLFFVSWSSNPTSEYSFYENIFLYFLFLTKLFNVLAGTTTSLLQSVTYKGFSGVDKTHDKSHRLHAMHYNIDLVVITTSSVDCDHKKKKKNNKQTDQKKQQHKNIKLPNQKSK